VQLTNSGKTVTSCSLHLQTVAT